MFLVGIEWEFSTKIAYDLCVNESGLSGDVGWVWKLPTLPKIRFFIWLSWFDRLPHTKTLCQRKITNDPMCDICNIHQENTLHVLRDCEFAREFWGKWDTPTSFFNSDLKDWLRLNLHSKKHVDNLPWTCLFSFCVWGLWKRRNEATQPRPPFNIHLPKLGNFGPCKVAVSWGPTTGG